MRNIWVLFFIGVCSSLCWSQADTGHEESEPPAYAGYWRFVREDLKKRHPLLPSFLINRALNTRLFLGDEFIQYRSPEKMLGKARPIERVEVVKDSHFRFFRSEGERQVSFEIFQKDQKWFYREGDLLYQVLRDTPTDQKRWRGESE